MFLFGVIAYFAAPQEPSLLVVSITSLLIGVTTVALRHKGRQFYIALTVFGLLAGFNAATFHTSMKIQAPLKRAINQTIKAQITSIEQRADGSRITSDH